MFIISTCLRVCVNNSDYHLLITIDFTNNVFSSRFSAFPLTMTRIYIFARGVCFFKSYPRRYHKVPQMYHSNATGLADLKSQSNR